MRNYLELGESGKVIDINSMVNNPIFGMPHPHCYKSDFFDVDRKWFPRDTEDLFDQNIKIHYHRKKLEDNGWTKDNISYKLNNQSFRHDGTVNDFDKVKSGGVAYVGDSVIFGIGVNLEQTFTYLSHPKELPYLNLGCPGSGVEAYYRVVKKWVPIIKPRLVVVFHTWVQTRTEIANSHKNIFMRYPYKDHLEDPLRRYDPLDVHIRWHKNIDAIKMVCSQVGAKVWVMEEPHQKQYKDFYYLYSNPSNDHYGRDLGHPGPNWNMSVSKHFKEIINDNL